MPRRYGNDVPDVQLVLFQEVSRDFVAWVERAFLDRGLRTHVMFLNPRFPREALVQRQVLEGVHAIIDLDYAAQTQNKVSIQVFKRAGGSSVRFEVYQDVDPPVAAELVVREKALSAPPQYHPPPQQPAYAVNPYGHPGYPVDPAAAVYAIPQYQQQHVPAHPAAQLQSPEFASMVGQLDNSALHTLIASLQSNQAAPAQQQQQRQQPVMPQQPHQVDIHALLGNLRTAAAAAAPAAPVYGAPAPDPAIYGAQGYGGGDATQHVQAIIEQLKRGAQ